MRRILLTAIVALVVVSSGCVGLITGETVEFEANNATVEEDARSSAGYELNNSSEQSITRDVEFLGQERTIRIVNQVSRYTSGGSLADVVDSETLPENETLPEDERLAENETLQQEIENETSSDTQVADLKQFIVVSSPGAKVAGQTLNPAASWSSDRILEQVADQTGQLDDIESDGSRNAESLGDEREVSEFTATTELKGQEIDVRLHVVSFEHEGDVVIAVGAHPEEIDEEENVDELLEGIEHNGN
ncbi:MULTISPECIES: DUF6517 family protein [Haloarcula]|uniref:DUF6517 family protein n=1 Tax=Haloarcula TaxID=2237 RepID=UPI0023E7A3B5|nr:DUF6517 family protein [Halomicroarcula sp. SHR3]